MATSKDTADFILARLGNDSRFTLRAMFGEYALYVDGKVVALICDNTLYVKIVPASAVLEDVCEQGPPYPGAKPHYIVSEEMLYSLGGIPAILIAVAAALPEKKKK